MESSNLHHQYHQLQDQLLVIGSSSSSLTTPSTYVAGGALAWTQNFTLNTTSNNFTNVPNLNNGVVLNPIRPKNDALFVHDLNTTSMIQDFGFHWINTNAGRFTTAQSSTHDHDLQLAKIKEELSSSDSFPKFTNMLTNNNPSSIEDSHLSDSSTRYINNESKDRMSDLSEKLLLKTISSGFPLNEHRFSHGDLYSAPAHHNSSSFGNGLVYPSINISNMNHTSSPPSFNMNLQALDLLTSTRFNGNISHPSLDNPGMYKERLCFGLDRLHQLSHRPSCSPSKLSSTNEISEAKRPNNSSMEAKATQAAPKKSRLESRASCPPFKVRKEKLGDRIAALQQLVAPFGKTDTASVLMEATGYIKFLQNQVETLSVPYMKSSHNKISRSMQAFQVSTGNDGNEEPKRDLRSRGLCLVPLSCLSYVTSDGGGGGGGFWPPPNFGGGT